MKKSYFGFFNKYAGEEKVESFISRFKYFHRGDLFLIYNLREFQIQESYFQKIFNIYLKSPEKERERERERKRERERERERKRERER